jgi:signal transduction histidine kinase
MSIRTYFLLFVGILAAAAIAAASTVIMIECSELLDATGTERMTRAFGAALSVQQKVSRERGHFSARLLGDPAANDDEAGLIAGTDAAFDAAIRLLQAEPGSQHPVAALEQIRHEFSRLRELAVAQIKTGRADATVDRRYVDRLVALMERVDTVADQVERVATAHAEPLARSYIEVARLAAIVRDYAGRRATRMIMMVSTGAPMTADLAQTLGNSAGRVQATWRRLQQITNVIRQIAAGESDVFPRDLEQAIETMDQRYFHDTEELYGLVIEAARTGKPSGMTVAELRRRHVPAIDTSVPIRDLALAHALRAAADDAHAAWLELAKASGLLLLLVATALGAALLLRRKVIGPLDALTRIIVRLAENDRSIVVPELPRHDEIGQLAQAIETLRANAERAVAAERERQTMEAQLRQAQKLEALGTLAGGIAHEINTPTQYVGDNIRFLKNSFADLGAVLECARALRNAAESAPQLALLATAQREAEVVADLDFLRTEIPTAIAQSLDGVDRIRQIVLAVKEFSHPDVKEVTAVDLNHAIETTITVSRNQWKYIAEVELALAPDLPRVPCRGGEINQVLLNLIVNAAHAVEAKGQGTGKITVATARRDGWAEIRVTDTGTGIPREICDRIFDPFFTTKAPGKGTGQGLAICHTIVVQKHGGSIEVDSILGKGATFVVRLPLETVSAAIADVEVAA